MTENLNLPPGHIEEDVVRKKRPGLKTNRRKKMRLTTPNKEKYEEFIKGNEFITTPEALDAVNTRTISLLTHDVKSRKSIGVSRETMKEALKSLSIGLKVLARRSNAMGNILLATEQEPRGLTGSILTSKSV